MPIKGLKSAAASSLLPFVLVVCCGTVAADPVVTRNVARFYAAFLGRELSREELRTLTDEYIELHAATGKSDEAIRETSRRFGARAKVLRPPRHREPSRQQIEELVAGLTAAVGGNTGNMPRFFGEAAGKMWRIQIPPRMYGLLWGLELAPTRFMEG